MSSAKKISYLIRYFLINSIGYIGCTYISFSQNLQVQDSAKALSAFLSTTNQSKIGYQKQLVNFYKTDSISPLHSTTRFFPSLIYDLGEQADAPFHFTAKQWLITGLSIGITATLIHFDGEIDEWARVQKQEHHWINRSSPFITKFGGNYGFYSVAGFGLLSAAFKSQKAVQTSLLATQAIITSSVWTQLIKHIAGRERPFSSYIFSKVEGGHWYGPFVQLDQDFAVKRPRSSFDSFPSGHTATAFSIATVFATQYKDNGIIPIISYSAATLVGVTRLTEHEHWGSDVFVGALIGYICGKQVISHYNKTHQSLGNYLLVKSKNRKELTFIQYKNQVGLFLKW